MARRRGEPRGKSPRRRAPFLDFFGGFPNAPNQPNPLTLTLPQHPFPQEKLRLPKVLILFPCGSPTSSLSAHHSLSLSLSLPTFLRPRRRAPAHDSSHLFSSMLDFHALSLDPTLVYNGVILDPTIFFPRT